ncbi:CDP-glucose 4,6-dehydratase [Treponema putidum]|uniref:CDP-glucose 4,6-dehydratase n=1 Tax=Treponema putidum TaxID=221027 RepID=A0AAE9MUU8_9SPIR|nr:CDP-glucose 4,6-dehydratase [Treponema putidum]UTY33206.1 CDP-glucose 4,6-dehydratase [Treponema putidum]
MLEFYKGKRIFITGHTGFKGTWLTRILLAAGADITGYALKPPTAPSLFELTDTQKHIHSVEADIADREKLIKSVKNVKPDIVFHLAAQPLVRLSYKEPAATYSTNVMGTVNILEAVRQCYSVKSFVNVTTDKVYENKEWCWGYRENENLCGFDPYSNSKSCSELVTYSYRNSFFAGFESPAISTARSGNVIGGGDYAEDRIIPDCIRAVQNNKPIVLRNPGSTRPYQHVLECLSGYLLLAQAQYEDKKLEGAYNFGPDDESCVTTGGLTDIFCKAWGNGVQWGSKDENGPHEANFLKLDNTKAKNMLHWNPHWKIKNAVEKVVEWEKNIAAGISAGEITDKQIKEYFTDEYNIRF